MSVFKSILDDQRSLPKDQPYKKLIELITFILRKFFKTVEEDPFLMIEVRHSSQLIYFPVHAMLIECLCIVGVIPHEPRTLEAVL